MNNLTVVEKRFAIIWLCVAAIAYMIPPLAQPQDYHHFADSRMLGLDIPNTFDVLSNGLFLVAGLWGCIEVFKMNTTLKYSLMTFFIGMALTSVGSAYYHWAPTDATLVWDRLPMTIAFAGVFGALGAVRISHRVGLFTLATSFMYGCFAIYWWARTGNLTPYVLMQFGGLLWIAFTWVKDRQVSVLIPWGTLLGFYIGSKVCEHFDTLIFTMTQGVLSGHSIKHLLAAGAGLAVARAIRRHNRSQL